MKTTSLASSPEGRERTTSARPRMRCSSCRYALHASLHASPHGANPAISESTRYGLWRRSMARTVATPNRARGRSGQSSSARRCRRRRRSGRCAPLAPEVEDRRRCARAGRQWRSECCTWCEGHHGRSAQARLANEEHTTGWEWGGRWMGVDRLRRGADKAGWTKHRPDNAGRRA